MKKIIGLSLCGVLLSTNLIAEQKEFPFPPVCSIQSIAWINEDRYLDLFIAARTTAKFFLDSQNFKIDKKNKTITAWIIAIERQEGRDEYTKVSKDFDNYGVGKRLIKFDYANQKSKLLQSSAFNCDGSVIYTKSEADWAYLVSGSVDEDILKVITNNLKLK